MPITIRDGRKMLTREFPDIGVTVSYYLAPGDIIAAAVRRGARASLEHGEDAEESFAREGRRLVARYIADVPMVDASGAAIQWPGAGKVEGVEGVEAPSAEEIEARADLLSWFPHGVVRDMDAAISDGFFAGVQSGKD